MRCRPEGDHMSKTNLWVLRALQGYLLIWPTLWGLVYIAYTITTPSSVSYLLGYASGAVLAILIILGALTRQRVNSLPLRFARWQGVAVILVLAAALIGPALAGASPAYSYIRLFLLFPLIAAGFAAALWLPTLTMTDWKRLVIAMGLGLIFFVSVVFPILPVYFEAIESDWGAGWERGIVPFYNIRRFTHSVIIAIAAGTGLWLWSLQSGETPQHRVIQAGIFLGLCFGWAVIFWAGSRAPTLAFALVVLVLLYPMAGQRLALLVAWLVPSVIGFLASLPIPCPRPNIGMRCRIDHYSQVQDLTINQLSSSRLVIWQETIDLIRAQPIFGYGHGQFSLVSSVDVQTPHNFPLELLFDFGLLGGIPMLILFYGGILFLLLRAYAQGLSPRAAVGLLVVLTMTFQAFLDGVITGYYRLVLFGVFWAMTWAALKLDRSTLRTKRA